MQEDNTTPPAADGSDEPKDCGCTCEACMAGNHDQCQTGMCKMKTPKQEPTDGQA